MTKIAFLGLGMMGTPMATRLLEDGHDLTVWDRTDEKTKALVDRGAVGEGLPLGEIFGLDHGVVLDSIADSPVGPTARAKRANIESDTYPPNFKLSLALKDMRLVTEAASGTGRDLKLAEASRAWLD